MLRKNARSVVGAVICVAMAVPAGPAVADGLSPVSVGGSVTREDFALGDNDAGQGPVGDESGYQGFGGFNFGPLLPIEKVDFRLEAGAIFVDGPFGGSANGIWATPMVGHNVTDRLTYTARLGWDFGDDDGLLYGAGIEYDLPYLGGAITPRLEFVERDRSSSLQLTVMYNIPDFF